MTSLTIFSFFGGILLLLYGMRLIGEGLQKAAGARLRGFLLTATSNRLRGVGVGAAITALLQSSSATTVMLVGFVGSGLLGLKETMGVILGADIGTTITVQIIAFRIYDYSIAIAGFGILLTLLGRRGAARDTGYAILGFGFVLLAIKILIDTFEPVTADPFFKDLLLGFSKDPLAGTIISAVLTALLHSSAATLGIAISAAYGGLLSLDAAAPIVLGANIGTCVSAVVSSIGASIDARRVALAHILFKVVGVLIVLPFLGRFTHLVSLATDDLPRQIAYAHTFFNIGLALLFLPFIGPFTVIVKKLLPERKGVIRFGPKYLDPLVLTTPPLAIGQATREALRLADIVQEMLRRSIDVFMRNDTLILDRIEEKDNDVDLLDREIKLYLTKLSRESLSEEQAKREMEIITFTNNMENIGDVIDKNLMELAKKKIRDNLAFSREGMAEIRELHEKVMENFALGTVTFAGSDVELARRLINHKAKVAEMERDMRQAHINRLHRGLRESIDTSAIHLDILTNLQRINSYIVNIAYPILEREKRD
ncbi:MAG: Na/Pi cotransporter family protein [Thermodesulfobacteriota bacterium]